MSKTIEVNIYDYGTDLYEFPSRYKATLKSPNKVSVYAPITGMGSTPEDAVANLVDSYRETIRREKEQERWQKLTEARTLIETREVGV